MSSRRTLAHLGLLAVMGLLLVVPPGPESSDASSHRDAPLITEDPTADNTDVYAFVSTQAGRSDHVTLIANYIPLEEPGEGPNYYRFSDSVLYEIKVDVDGDLREDLTFEFDFTTKIVNGNTFLYNTGVIGPPPNPGDPSSQYANLNVQQGYNLSLRVGQQENAQRYPVLQNARVAPIRVGPKSLLGTAAGDTAAAYDALANAATFTLGTAPNDIRIFVGPRDEGFYVDLMGAFDLVNPRATGVDTTSGFNVHTIALEVPKALFQVVGDTDSIIGVWATASRDSTGVVVRCIPTPTLPCPIPRSRQVSRLGNPLVNEVLIPLEAKDRYNMSNPVDDEANIANFIVNPGNSQGAAALVPFLNTLTGCTATNGRADLQAALLTGIPAGIIPGFPGNYTGTTRGDVLRLNYSIAPSANPSPLGLAGGDIAGWPNGRRVGDDVTDVALKAAGGALQPLVGLPACAAAGGLTDNVNGNDVPYLTSFPYLARPHEGYRHAHDHD